MTEPTDLLLLDAVVAAQSNNQVSNNPSESVTSQSSAPEPNTSSSNSVCEHCVYPTIAGANLDDDRHLILDEAQRIAKLNEYQVMTPDSEPELDRIVLLTKKFFDIPMVAITFLDCKVQLFKSEIGLNCQHTPRDIAFCNYTIKQTDIFTVLDTHLDARFAQNPLVTGAPYIRFYAGVPILVRNKQGQSFALGALCLIDDKPRPALTTSQIETLKQFSAIISDTLELRLQQRRAERADEIKSVFLANMSHEIRTPMNGIMGILDLLEQTPLEQTQSRYIKHIKQANNHLLTIVNDILDLSKVEAGKMRFNYIAVDLKTLCEELMGVFKGLAQEQQVSLTLIVDKQVPRYIKADPVRVRQIISNLLNNAIKFTPKKGMVTLQVVQAALDNSIQLRVIDTGVGIKPESQAVIFDAYNQADKFTHRVYGGTGLGLSVCKALAECMGGTVTVESEEGVGSTFSLCLPMQTVSEADYHLEQTEQDPNHDHMTRLPAHVLLAEDNELNAMVATKILKKFGYEVTRVQNGKEAVNVYTQAPEQFQIVLMDHQMPIMNGVEATRLLKKQFGKLPPIIAVTAHAMHGDKEVYIQAGMQDYLTKPYRPDVLDSAIQTWLNRYQQMDKAG